MPSDDITTLGRRQLLSSAAVISASSTAAGVGTWSLFIDEAETKGEIRAGTLELSTTEKSAASITIGPVSPGDEGIEAIELVNEGSVAGNLRLAVGDVIPVDRQTRSENEASAGGDNDDATSSGDVTDVEFNGCGKADLVIAESASFPIDVTATVRRDGDLRKIDYTVEAADGKGSRGSNGRDARASIRPTGGKLVRVNVGEREWWNRSPCAQSDDSSGVNGDVSDAVTAEIGFSDDPTEAGSNLFGPSRLDEISTDRTAEADRTLAPATDDTGPDTTFLYVAWEASDEIEDADGNERIAIELRPELRT